MIRLTIATVLLFVAVCRPDCAPTVSTASGPYAPKGKLCKNQLIFSEDFNNLNRDLWQNEVHFGGPNGEFQWYTDSPKNSFTKNGVLFLKPTVSSTAVQSALVKTANKFNFKYGRVVIRAKLPSGKWLWPALWFLPTFNKYGNWPLSGEIDLVESRGNPNTADGVRQFGSTLHFGTAWNNDDFWSSHVTVNSPNGQGFDAEFHEYGLEWTPDHIQITLDGKVRGTFPTGAGYFQQGKYSGNNPWANGGRDAPFDQEFFFILNNAVGGTNGYFVDGQDNKPWRNGAGNQVQDFWNARNDWLSTWNFDDNAQRSVSLQVDYIRLYAL